MRILRSLLVLALVATAIVAAAAGWARWRYQQAPITFERANVQVRIDRGMSLRAAGKVLRDAGMDVPDWALGMIGRYRDDVRRIHAGTYAFSAPLTLESLIDRMVAGDVLSAEQTIIEGWTFRQMRAAIGANPDLRADTREMTGEQLMARLGLDAQKPEGLFFPSTYRFDVGASDLEVFQMAARQLQQVLDRQWAAREPDLPLRTPYEALVLASIVEKETGTEADRKVIAGVFINRLRAGMMLQSDPTTIYGLGEAFDGDLKRVHLVTDTPWNTYTRKGLPPTPIALVSEASLEAVLHPAKTAALYFVARGDGSSQFSDTLADHNRAVRKFQLKRP